MKKVVSIIITVLVLCLTVTACGVSKEEYRKSLEQYPNSGEIEFNDVMLTIPEGYIRDTTMEGTEEGIARRWEKGGYKTIVTISRYDPCDINEETFAQVREDQQQISNGQVTIEMIDFHGEQAIESHIPIEGGELNYLIFNAVDHAYHFSVQGDTDDYETIKESIRY